jgi:hypothetical protein
LDQQIGPADGRTEPSSQFRAPSQRLVHLERLPLGVWKPSRAALVVPGRPDPADLRLTRRVLPTECDEYRPGGRRYDAAPVVSEPGAALCERIGPGALLTHSVGGYVGCVTAMRSANVRTIVSYEPARFVFADRVAPSAAPISGGRGIQPRHREPHAEFVNSSECRSKWCTSTTLRRSHRTTGS